MDVSVKELEVTEFGLAGEMDSLHEPPRFWKVIVDDVIHCVCVSEEHAGAIADSLKKAKSLGKHFDNTLNAYKVWANKVVVARCAGRVVRHAAVKALTAPALSSAIEPTQK